jgi:hypothetical protein
MEDVMPAQNPHVPTRPGFRPKLRYQKQGLGSLYLFDSIIKPYQTISCYPEDIPAQYKDVLVCIDTPEMQTWATKESGDIAMKEVLYETQERETKGWYDVVNTDSGKAINEKRLRKADAETLRDSLNS